MTYEQFLAKLRETPRDWAATYPTCMNGTEGIRRIHNGVVTCPLCEVAGVLGEEGGIAGAALFGLSPIAPLIANAADGDEFDFDTPRSLERIREVRADLLQACGLAPAPEGGR